MKYSYQWLRDISQTTKSVDEVAYLLMAHSFEVENIERAPDYFWQVVVGEILEVKKHPDADKLSLCKVRVSQERDPLAIVCGAKNIAVGDKVPVALPGTTLPSGMMIAESVIRGERSQGMLCASDELGLGNDHSGIVQLPRKAVIGMPIADVLGKNDSVLDIKILANRGHDALSHVGMAREICACERRNTPYEFLPLPEILSQHGKDKNLRVSIEEATLCKRYVGVVLENITVGPSPEWMCRKLESCGMRSVNNVVDITNYVMLELGQPMHAFDFVRAAGSNDSQVNIHARHAREGETLRLLDGREIQLDERDVVIANQQSPMALAGIMGGEMSGIHEQTTSIVLEAASFHPSYIRASCQRHALATDSAYRFEREPSVELTVLAVARALELLQEITDARAVALVDTYPKLQTPKTIAFDVSSVEKLLGRLILPEDACKTLEYLGCKVSPSESEKVQNHFDVVVPWWRLDLVTSQDIVEEIGRIVGYETIVPTPLHVTLSVASRNSLLKLEDAMRKELFSLGVDESLTYSFYARAQAHLFSLPEEEHFSLRMPMNSEQELVRASLVPNVMKKLKENLRRSETLALFEIGKTYRFLGNNESVRESRECVIAVAIEKDASDAKTFFSLKGLVESLIDRVVGQKISVQEKTQHDSYFHPTRSGTLFLMDREIGAIGEIHPLVCKKLNILKRVALCRLDMHIIDTLVEARQFSYAHPSQYPAVRRDISVLVPHKTMMLKVRDSILISGGSLLVESELFDDFTKDGNRSLAFHLSFQSPDRTLSGAEVDEAMEKIFLALEKENMRARIQ